jgi:arylsulfatase A-like enzyme
MLRGQYAHNTNIMENEPGFQNFFRNKREDETLATWLHKAGYNTALAGKYMNTYPVGAGKRYVPPGWTDWHVFMYEGYERTFYYGYKMNENGKVVQYGDTPEDYSTDVIKRQSLDFMNQSLDEKSPFFMLISVIAPHGPSTPANRHTEIYKDLVYPKKPSFYEADLSDKPSTTYALANSGDDFDTGDADTLFTRRVQTMQAVDELVGEVILLLKQRGQLDNTYIFFTSDNGIHMGEHKLPSIKGLPYEEDIHVPMLVRGPGIQPGLQITSMTANIDLAPTIADLTQVTFADFIDGRSLLPFLHPQAGQVLDWRKSLLIESGYLDLNSDTVVFRGVRTEKFVYIEYQNGELEYYDLIQDPYQLENKASQLDPATLASLHAWVEELKVCKAEECRTAEMDLPDDLKNLP